MRHICSYGRFLYRNLHNRNVKYQRGKNNGGIESGEDMRRNVIIVRFSAAECNILAAPFTGICVFLHSTYAAFPILSVKYADALKFSHAIVLIYGYSACKTEVE